jgi:hypothetical protein
MHDKRRYVKSAWIAGVVALAHAAPAAAGELVAAGIREGALAVTPAGSPRVAYVTGRSLIVATRSNAGAWTRVRVARLPTSPGRVAGIAVSRNASTAVLAEDPAGRWLTLAWRERSSWQVFRLVRRVRSGRLGHGGLTLDSRSRPVVAYAVWRRTGATFLRLVRREKGRFRTRGVTRGGFPPSSVPPAAAPVRLPNGKIRVVEGYGSEGSAVIDWMPLRNDWLGQFLYSSPIGTLVGPVAAAAGPDGTVHAAWTEIFPSLGETGVALATHGEDVESTVILEHALLGGLTVEAGGPLVAASDSVDFVPLALLRAANGAVDELDGTVAGVAVDGSGRRHVLDAADGDLFWFRGSATTPHVSLTAAPRPGAVALSGRVSEGSGAVTIYRERPGEQRVAIASAPLAADGSFTAQDSPGPGRFLYRAVYSGAGLPAAALLREPVGQGAASR